MIEEKVLQKCLLLISHIYFDKKVNILSKTELAGFSFVSNNLGSLCFLIEVRKRITMEYMKKKMCF